MVLDIAVVLFQLVSVNAEPPWPLDVICMSPKGVCVGSLVLRVAYDGRLWTFERWGTMELPSKGIEVSHHAPDISGKRVVEALSAHLGPLLLIHLALPLWYLP